MILAKKLVKESSSVKSACEVAANGKKITFNGTEYASDNQKVYVRAKFCHSFPFANVKGRSFHPATLANSYETARHHLFDFDHTLTYYGQEQNEICGAIIDTYFPSKVDALAAMNKGDSIAMEVLFVLWRKVEDVQTVVEELNSDKNEWATSMECEYIPAESAFAHDGNIIPVLEAPDEMLECVGPYSISHYEGKPLTLLMGGVDGEVLFSGGALTKMPADGNAKVIDSTANRSIQFQSRRLNYLNLHNTLSAHSEVASKGFMAKHAKDKPKQEIKFRDKTREEKDAANLVIGLTDPAEDGHQHEVLADMSIRAAQGHRHWLDLRLFDPTTGTLEGVTDTHGEWDVHDNRVVHDHRILLGPAVQPAEITEEVSMDPKQEAKFLREQAKAIKDEKVKSSLLERASKLEEEGVDQIAEDTIAARIESGDLVPKTTHEEAIEKARKEAAEKIETEQREKAEAEEKEKAAKEARVKAISDAGLDPKGQLTKEQTLEDYAMAIPFNEEGEKQFKSTLEMWTNISEKTKQWKPSKANASKSGTPGIFNPSSDTASDDDDEELMI